MNLADKLRKINRFLQRAAEGLTVFVDVKTIMPEPKDRWEQFEKKPVSKNASRTYTLSGYPRNGWAAKSGMAGVSIHRQSRWLYGCWPLKGAFSQPSEAKARTKAKASYCCLHCRSTGNSRENILPEFSKFYCHPGRAGRSPHPLGARADAGLTHSFRRPEISFSTSASLSLAPSMRVDEPTLSIVATRRRLVSFPERESR
jgi:hypothetical protein